MIVQLVWATVNAHCGPLPSELWFGELEIIYLMEYVHGSHYCTNTGNSAYSDKLLNVCKLAYFIHPQHTTLNA